MCVLSSHTKQLAHLFQEGFLLGEIVEKKTSNITDNDEQVTKIDRMININSIISWPKRCYFYNSIGEINKQKISNFLGDKVGHLVGWYKLKITGGIYKQTLREKIVHKELSKAFGPHSDLFVCGLFKADTSQNGATHTNMQTFIRYMESGFHNVPMRITNLSDSNNMYKTPQNTSDSFKKVMTDLKMNLEETPSLVAVNEIHTALLKRIDRYVSRELNYTTKDYDSDTNCMFYVKVSFGFLNDSHLRQLSVRVFG